MRNPSSVSTKQAHALSAVLGILTMCSAPSAVAADGLCAPLRDFVTSVKPGETRVLKFHSIWGGNFKDRQGTAVGAKRCDFADYAPAKAVCKYLMDYASVDSPGYNAKTSITCVSPKTRFAAGTKLDVISFATSLNADGTGNLVEVALGPNNDLGGIELSIKTTGK